MRNAHKSIIVLLGTLCLMIGSTIPVAADTLPTDLPFPELFPSHTLDVSLLVPFREMTAAPGQTSIDMPIGVINNSQGRISVVIEILDIPGDWNIGLWDSKKNYKIEQISLEAQQSREAELRLALPVDQPPGNYQFSIQASSASDQQIYEAIPVHILVRKPENQRLGTIIASSDFPVLSGPTTALFEFQINVKNRSSVDEQFALSAEPPMGWGVGFFPGWQQERAQSISNLSVEKGGNTRVEVQVMPPRDATPGRYAITVNMSNEQRTIVTPLSVQITGSGILLSRTGSGLREMEAQPGVQAPALFRLLNIGTAAMNKISLRADVPTSDWTVDFDRKTIDVLEVNAQSDIGLTITPPSDVIPGDYIVTAHAVHADSDTSVEWRITVKETNAWQWLGILIVLIVVGTIGGLFWRLGRRQ